MWGVPVPDDEVARRKALGAAMWARQTLPPLYRVATMDPETVLHGCFGASSPVMTHYIFPAEDGLLHRPRLEVHTFERGAVDDGAPILWHMRSGSGVPKSSGEAESVPVAVSGSPLSGLLLAAEAEGWMVSVEASDATLLVMGPGELPRPLSLEPVDLHALRRSELRYSGLDEA